MSSHHIIRENQEPALIIDDFNLISEDLLGQLLEWSPTLITHELGLFQSMRLGIKVDYVILNGASSEHFEKISDMVTDGIILINSKKNFNEASMDLLVQLKNFNANIVSYNFPFEYMVNMRKDYEMNLVLLKNDFRYFVSARNFSKWKSQGSLLHFPLNLGTDLQTQNLKHLGKEVYETISDGFIELKHKNLDFLIIGESLQ